MLDLGKTNLFSVDGNQWLMLIDTTPDLGAYDLSSASSASDSKKSNTYNAIVSNSSKDPQSPDIPRPIYGSKLKDIGLVQEIPFT
jgi:hypothetical protein